jgi:hypothetical protein
MPTGSRTRPASRRSGAADVPGARPDLAQLEAEARYHRDRLTLYRARIYASKPTSGKRLRELERAAAYAAERLQRARHG